MHAQQLRNINNSMVKNQVPSFFFYMEKDMIRHFSKMDGERWSRGVGRSITFTDLLAPVCSRASCLNELHTLRKSWWNHIFGRRMFCTHLGIRLSLGPCVEHFQEGAISISRLQPLSFSCVVIRTGAPFAAGNCATRLWVALQISLFVLILLAIPHLLVVFKD